MKILIVEDDQLIRLVFLKNLIKLGHEVTEASNGKEAWDLFAEGSFDFIITDIMMPFMSGIELAKAINNSDNPIPIFAITASSPKSLESEHPGLFKRIFSKSTLI